MKEHIDRISKHIDRIKEIVWNDRDLLDWDTSGMSEDEIHKMSEVWKAASSIENYNIMNEYSRFKRINNYIRLAYFLIMWLVIWFIILVTADYIQVKIDNQNVSQVESKKAELEKKVLSMQETIDQSKEKNDEISILLAQKENSVKELTKELDDIKTQIKENKTSITTNENTDNKYDNKTNESIITTTATGTVWDNKNKCISQTSITINLRESAGLKSNVITFLSEWTSVEVLKERFVDWRQWYQVQTAKNTWWIANIWIENFDNTCLKK